MAPAAVLVAGLGVWLVIQGDTWTFEQSWIQAGIGMFVVVFLIGVGFLSRAGLAADRAVARGDHEEASRQLRRWSWGVWVIVVVLVAATWDMVVKPGL